MASAEQRAYPRVATALPVRVVSENLEIEGEAEPMGEIADYGQGGMFVRCDFLEPPGTRVTVHLDLGEDELVLRGRVVWVTKVPPRGPGMGIALELGQEAKRALDRLSGE